MNVFMRGAVRRTTVGLGALALAAGAAACGGGGEQEPAPEDTGVEEPTGDEGDSEASDAGGEQPAPGDAPSDGGGMFDGGEETDGDGETSGDEETSGDDEEDSATESELSEEDLDAATERFLEFVRTVGDDDAEAACSMVINPDTGETGDEDPECVQIFEEDVSPVIQGGELGNLDASMVDAEDNGDGTVSITLDDSPFALPMVQGEDGTWYIDFTA